MKKESKVVNAEFEIIETKLIPATEETKGVQLFAPDTKEKVIQGFINAASLSFTLTPSDCKKLVKESSKLTIKDRGDVEGYEKVKAANWKLVKARTSTNDERKTLTDPFNKIKAGIDNVAKNDILGVTAAEEARTKALLDQWKEWEREEIEKAEREAKERLDKRVNALIENGIEFDGAFYSVGSVSVDIKTIEDLADEHFTQLLERTLSESEILKEKKRIIDLHNTRREEALPFIAYWTEEEKQMNFGEVSKEKFEIFINRIIKASEDFENEKKNQEEEKQRQMNERKALNYEKRSFKLEKEGFVIDEEYKEVFFSNEVGRVSFSKYQLETFSEEDFQELFSRSIKTKADFEAKFENIVEERLNQSKRNAEELELKKQKEIAERLERLPEIEKALIFIHSFKDAEIPNLKSVEINEIVAAFKYELKLACDTAFSSLEKFK